MVLSSFIVGAGGTVTNSSELKGPATTFSQAAATAAAAQGSSLATMATIAAANPDGYNFNRQLPTTPAGTQYAFHSGPAIAVLNPSSELAKPGFVLANGLTVDKYLTATNILSATDPTGSQFLNRVASTTAAGYASTVVPIFEATRASIASVALTAPTADMRAFYQVGVANGSFPDTAEGKQTAISNYAAAITLSVIEAGAQGNAAWDVLAAQGVKTNFNP